MQAHAKQLEEKVRNWQQSAIESEAISRAKTSVVLDHTNGQAPIELVGEKRFDQIIEQKKSEVIEQWGINPWQNDQKNLSLWCHRANTQGCIYNICR